MRQVHSWVSSEMRQCHLACVAARLFFLACFVSSVDLR